MKKFIPALILLLTATAAFAQIQLTGADMPRTDNVNLVSIDTLSQPNIGVAADTAQTWDFTSLNQHYPQVASYSPLTPYQAYGAAFPGANLFTYGPSYLYSGFLGGTPVNSNAWGYMYWRSDSTGFYICGFRGNYGTGETNIAENPQEMLMRTPATLDSVFTGNSRWIANIANNPFDADTHYISNVYKTLYCDAFGQMTTPFGAFNVLRVHEAMIRVDSITGTIGSIPIYGTEYRRDTTHNYYFWANGIGYPVAIVKADNDSNIMSVEYLHDTLAAATITGTVYKNDSVALVTSGTAQLIARTAIDQLYGIPETVPLTAGGHFQFANVIEGGHFLVQAQPDTTIFPYEIPTYYGDAVYWMTAYTLTVTSDTGILIHTASDSAGYASTGNGSISGTIWQNLDGAKNMQLSGGVKVTLEQNPSGSVVRHTYTDTTGRYSFKNLPAVNFRLHVDIPAITMDSTYYLYYSGGDTNTANLDFYYDSLYIYIYNTSGIEPLRATFTNDLLVFPNPANQQITLAFNRNESNDTKITIYDICGKIVSEEMLGTSAGENLILIDLYDYKPGLYFVKVTDAHQSSLVKFIKQ